jgi:hypothetical protein
MYRGRGFNRALLHFSFLLKPNHALLLAEGRQPKAEGRL